MYEEFPSYELPNKEQKIWRYMDFTKFMSMLDKEEIYFTRADKFTDKFEGTFPRANRELRQLTFQRILSQAEQEMLFTKQDEMFEYNRGFVTINCWHMNDYESAAMWDLYLKSSEGVAIQSNIGKLIESFAHCSEKIRFGKVNYKDFKKEPIEMDDFMDMFVYKRKSFEHEREIRAIHQIPFQYAEEGWINDDAESPVKHGLGISCDIRVLIERVYISPTAPSWFEELVRSMCDKYNLHDRVFKSELSELPY